MNANTFTGEASITNIPQGCTMSFYTETNSGAVPNLEKSHAATDSWYGGNTHYDYANGKYKDSLTAAQKKLAQAFTRMIWKSTQTVAFGIKGQYVAAWYCNVSGTTNSNGQGVTASATEPMATFKANVLPSCLVLETTATTGLKMHNACFNKRETESHNKKRDIHEAKRLNYKFEIAKEIQHILNNLPRGEKVAMPAAAKRPAAYRDCGENIYTSTDRLRLFTSSLATDGWYAGSAQYDFAKHQPKNP